MNGNISSERETSFEVDSEMKDPQKLGYSQKDESIGKKEHGW